MRQVVVVEVVVRAVAEVVPEVGLLLHRERGREHATGEEAEEVVAFCGDAVYGLVHEREREVIDEGECDAGGKREPPRGVAGQPEERGGGDCGGGQEEPVDALGHCVTPSVSEGPGREGWRAAHATRPLADAPGN